MNAYQSLRRTVSNARGQSIIEFALILPFILIVVLGVVELGYALQDQHILTKLTREGSNLISRDTSLQDAATALKLMGTAPLNFDNGTSTMIFTVIKKGATTGTANYNTMIVYQRYTYGSFPGVSKINMRGSGSFSGPPDYAAANSDSNSSLQVTNLPANLVTLPGGMIYVTEIYSRHTLITPLNRFGINVPQTLYSIAYF
jgi:Flp pilus assembly protein TadG